MGFETPQCGAFRAPSPYIPSCGVNVRLEDCNGVKGRTAAWLRVRRPANGRLNSEVTRRGNPPRLSPRDPRDDALLALQKMGQIGPLSASSRVPTDRQQNHQGMITFQELLARHWKS